MKRSEMVDIIYNIMKDNHFGQYGEFGKMANDVLSNLEDNCMAFTEEQPDGSFKIKDWDNEH